MLAASFFVFSDREKQQNRILATHSEGSIINVFEAGVVLHLVDRVSSGLGGIAMQFTRTQTAANALQARLTAIGNTFNRGLVVAAGGMALAAPLIGATREAEKYQHQLNQMKSAGLSNVEMANAIGAAWKTTGSVITSTATENLKVIMDLRSVFGHTQEGIDYLPKFAKIQGAYASILDGKLSKHADALTFDMAKSLDMIGRVRNPMIFNKSAEAMFKTTEATGGRVTSADYLQVFKYARQAKFGMGDDFLWKVLPELILENKTGNGGGASGVGTQIAALYRFTNQGIMNKRTAEKLQAMGMVPASSILKTTTTGTTLKGGVLGSALAAENPLRWVNEIFVPHLAKANRISLSDKDRLVAAAGEVFKGNQLATSLVQELIKKQQQYARFGPMYDKTDSVDQAYNRGMKNDPAANWKALDASFRNLNTVIGIHVLPVLIPRINEFATAIQKTSLMLKDNPGIAKAVAGVTALSSGALILGGSALMVKSAFMGLQLICGPLVQAISTLGLRGLGPLGLAITAVSLAVSNWDKIMGFVRQHQDFFIVAADKMATAMDNLGAVCQKVGTWIAGVVGQLGGMLSRIPAVAAIGANLQSFANNLPKLFMPSKEEAAAARLHLIATNRSDWVGAIQTAGLAGTVNSKMGEQLVSFLKKPAGGVNADNHNVVSFLKAAGQKRDVNVTDKSQYHVTVNVTGLSKAETEEAIRKAVTQAQKAQLASLAHKASAASGNSVGRSIFTGGATRP